MALLLIKLGPDWLTKTDGLKPDQQDEARGRVRTALFALLAGVIALVGAVYTGRTFALNRRGQITERFTRAIDQLGHEQIEIRLGGIYALERIAHESRDEHGPIMEVLTAYVRENSPWPPRRSPAGRPPQNSESKPVEATTQATAGSSDEPPEASVDIKAILTVLSRRNLTHEKDRWRQFNLAATNLHGVQAQGIDLNFAILVGAQLQRAGLFEALLERASLTGAQLQGAILHTAQLQGADLAGAQLQKADLDYAQLQNAGLFDAQLQRAGLTGAQLQEADLTGAQLQEADLTFANLDRAQLQEADLTGASLQRAVVIGAHLQAADLTGAQLQEADLTGAQLQEADLTRASLRRAVLIGAHLQEADLTGAQLQEADLTGAQLRGAILQTAQLQGADLAGAQLQEADLDHAQLHGASCTGSTTWPPDFDWQGAGVLLVEERVLAPASDVD